ncbi:MAG: hypothetical protein SFU98_22170 [Leptospiraceae bacterium]|nr:hypothetical protein [Leptospiraceae bacterium]
MNKFIGIFLFSFCLLSSDEPSLKKSINFTQKSESGESLAKEDFAGYHELKRWASFQNIFLQPDNPMGMLKDGICRMIPETGLKFYLEAPVETKKKIYLFLDITTYENPNNVNIPNRRLKVYIGGKLKTTILFQQGHVEENPARITLEPSDLKAGRINVFLEPDVTTGGRFWGIWDAFYSFSKE